MKKLSHAATPQITYEEMKFFATRFGQDGKWKLATLGLTGYLSVAAGCGGQEETIGEVRATFNVDRCHGKAIHCSGPKEVRSASRPIESSCPSIPSGALELDPEYSVPLRLSKDQGQFALASDGSIWVLGNGDEFLGADEDATRAPGEPGLRHYSATGELLGASGHAHELQASKAELKVDTAGNAIVLSFGKAKTAIGRIAVHAKIRVFDAMVQQVGSTLAIEGLAAPHLSLGRPGDVMLLGLSSQDDSCEEQDDNGYEPAWVVSTDRFPQNSGCRGIVARLNEDAPMWIQSNAVDSRAARSITADKIAGTPSGTSFVLAHKNTQLSFPGSAGAANWYVIHLDSKGNPLWEVSLLEGEGSGQDLFPLPSGGVLVQQQAYTGGKLFWISKEGQLERAYSVTPPAEIAVEAETGSILALTQTRSTLDGVIGATLNVIPKDGSSCRSFEVPELANALPAVLLPSPVASSPYVYIGTTTGIRRYRVPVE